MSSSEDEDVSHSTPLQSPEQVEQQNTALLSTLERVRNLIDAEVEIANFQHRQEEHTTTRRPIRRQSSLVSQRISFFEYQSTPNLASGSTCWLSGLPLYQSNFSPEKAVASVPTSPR